MAHRGHGVDLERARLILALETSCDDTCAAVVTERGRDPLQRDLLAGSPRPLRRRRPRDRLAPPSRPDRRGGRRRAGHAPGTRSTTSSWSRSRCGPGLVGALLIGVATAKALAAAHELPLAPVDHLHGHVAAAFLGPAPLEPPFLSLIASGGHTLLARVDDHGPGYEVLGADARRRRRRGIRQGRPPARARLPGRPGARAAGARGRSARVLVPDRAHGAGAGLLVRRAEDRAAVPGARAGRCRRPQRRRADLAASYQRAIVESLALQVERALAQTGLEQLAIGGGVAANGPLRERMSGLGVTVDVPPRELCTDNAAMIASAARFVEALPVPGLPRRRRVRHRRADAGRCDDHGGSVRPRGLLPVRRRPGDAGAGPRSGSRFELQERDIESDDALLRTYLERIPVIDDRRRGGVRAARSTRPSSNAGSIMVAEEPDELHGRPR